MAVQSGRQYQWQNELWILDIIIWENVGRSETVLHYIASSLSSLVQVGRFGWSLVLGTYEDIVQESLRYLGKVRYLSKTARQLMKCFFERCPQCLQGHHRGLTEVTHQDLTKFIEWFTNYCQLMSIKYTQKKLTVREAKVNSRFRDWPETRSVYENEGWSWWWVQFYIYLQTTFESYWTCVHDKKEGQNDCLKTRLKSKICVTEKDSWNGASKIGKNECVRRGKMETKRDARREKERNMHRWLHQRWLYSIPAPRTEKNGNNAIDQISRHWLGRRGRERERKTENCMCVCFSLGTGMKSVVLAT